ncbi:MAG: ATP-binding protein [Gammaproteobacteria bacterium]|jgi:signal transduction histidine kinase
MKRTLTVIVVAIAALALLVGAALESRSIPLEAHIARYTLRSELANLETEFRTLVTSLETAWQTSQPPGEAASALQRRMVRSTEGFENSIELMPGGMLQLERVENNLDRLRATMATVDDLTSTLLREQTEYANNLTLLRDDGPAVVQQLRTIGDSRVAADVFQLTSETVDFAAPENSINDYEIGRLLATLNRDRRIDPVLDNLAGPLLEAVSEILEAKDSIRSRLRQLDIVPLVDNAAALNEAASASYEDAVAGAENARRALLVFAALLLATVGFIGYRLRRSYAELNEANDELADLNGSLEQRVQERTHDLSTALGELKESQVQLVQAEKMSSLGQLVAGISHEINTPLLYLANNATLVQERIEPLRRFIESSARTFSIKRADFDDRSEFQNDLVSRLNELKQMLREYELEDTVDEINDLMRDSIDGIADLTEMAQSLKDFSRLDRAPIDSFDVNAGLDKTLNIARNSIKHKADVRKEYGDIPSIECSPSKINQVFLNLLTNAAQAIEERGEIVISTALEDDSQVVVSISDTGCGIPKENLERICDPFFTTKEVGSGTGLGLSIVADIVRSHSGKLEIESQPGAGSTFKVILPIKQPEQTGDVEKDEAAVDRILAEAV